MTIATGDAGGPWCAPVYFVYAKGAFWFFSSGESRHVTSGSRMAAVSIHEEGDSLQAIRGLQMTGRITHQMGGAISAFARYLKKFPKVRSIAGAGMYDPEQFGGRFGNRFHRFEPETIRYMDNRYGLGFKQFVTLDEGS